MKLFLFTLLVAVVGGVEFKLNNTENQACIILQLDASLSITATEDEKKFTKDIDVSEVEQTSITGACGDWENETSAWMKVNLGFGEWTLTFSKEDPVEVVQMFSFVPSVLINETLTNETVTLASNSTSLSSQNKSFICKSKLQVQFNLDKTSSFEYGLTQEISNLQVQAFNVKNSNFSKDVEECAQDSTSPATEQTTQANSSTEVPTTQANSSTEVPTTQANSSTEVPTTEPATTTPIPVTTVIPTPPAKPNKYILTGDNRTCIVFQATIGFKNLTYENNKNETAHLDFYIPEMNTTEAKVSGSCGLENDTMEMMTITFNTNWTLELTFKKPTAADASLLAASEDYSVSNINFTYYRSADIFPGVSPSQQGTPVTENAANLTDFLKGQTGGSYKCNADVKQPLGSGVSLETKNLQYKAFNADNNQDFNDNVSECSSDDESNSIVPIAVGAALAGLVVIVLIAYLIGRRRSRKSGYESV